MRTTSLTKHPEFLPMPRLWSELAGSNRAPVGSIAPQVDNPVLVLFAALRLDLSASRLYNYTPEEVDLSFALENIVAANWRKLHPAQPAGTPGPHGSAAG